MSEVSSNQECGSTHPRRGTPRLRLGIRAQLDLVGGPVACFVDDISATGAQLRLVPKQAHLAAPAEEVVIRRGEQAFLTFEGLELFGEVKRGGTGACGIEFDKALSSATLITLRQSAPQIIERDVLRPAEYARDWATGK